MRIRIGNITVDIIPTHGTDVVVHVREDTPSPRILHVLTCSSPTAAATVLRNVLMDLQVDADKWLDKVLRDDLGNELLRAHHRAVTHYADRVLLAIGKSEHLQALHMNFLDLEPELDRAELASLSETDLATLRSEIDGD